MKNKRIAVVGLGWSGSGALIELFAAIPKINVLYRELDDFRVPASFDRLKSGNRIWIPPLLFADAKNLLKSILTLRLSRSIQVLKTIIFSMRLIGVNHKSLKSRLPKNIVLDQPFFLEQFSEPWVKSLFDEVFIVIREPEAQLSDISENYTFLRPMSVKENFLFGFGKQECPDEHFMNLIAHSILYRLELLEDLHLKGMKLTLVKFESLISDPEYMDSLSATVSNHPSKLTLKEFSDSRKNNKRLIKNYKNIIDERLLVDIRSKIYEFFE